MKLLPFVFAPIALLAVVVHGQGGQGSQARNLEGAWKVTSVVTPQQKFASPQPSLYIFTKKYYSIMRINGDVPRPVSLSKDPSALELQAMYGPTFSANSGSYSVTGDVVTLTPIVAKYQGITGVPYTLQIAWIGPALTLTDSRYGGEVVTLSRVE